MPTLGGAQPSAPVAHWTFDEGQGTIAADVAGGHDGTLEGGPTWVPGIVGGALRFDGVDDSVTFAGTDFLRSDQPFSLSLWIDGERLENDAIEALLSFSTDGVRAFQVSIADHPSYERITFGSRDDSPFMRLRDGSGSPGNLTGQWIGWTHLAFTFAGNDPLALDEYRFYLNGALQSLTPLAADLLTGNTNRIAAHDLGFHFRGVMDDLRVYDRVLTPEDVQALFASGAALPPKELSATVVSGTRVLVAWRPVALGTAYQVFRDDVLIATVPDASFFDVGLEAGTTYEYVVRTVGSDGGASAASSPRGVTTPADADAPISAASRGYQPRPCGFDLDDDGVIGEPLDDCRIADGQTSDPDGDGVDEDILYVDCQRGSDVTGDGSAAQPFGTIEHAVGVADGASDGAEDIVAFTGVCTFFDAIRLDVGGVPASHTAPHFATDTPTFGPGHDQFFSYPSDPFMLVGWDRDADGVYPPLDVDDIAIIDADIGGGPTGPYTNRAFVVAASFVEMAHLVIKDFGRANRTLGSGVSGFAGIGGDLSHLSFHDIVFRDVLRSAGHVSENISFDVFNADETGWVAIENNRVENFGAYWMRGSATDAHDWRIDHNTFTAFGATAADVFVGRTAPGVTFFRPWEELRFSISYNLADGQVERWHTGDLTDVVVGYVAAVCAQEIVFRANVLRNVTGGFGVRLTSGVGGPDEDGNLLPRNECKSRPVTAIWDRNIVLQDSPLPRDVLGLAVGSGSVFDVEYCPPGEPPSACEPVQTIHQHLGTSSITNNLFYFGPGVDVRHCIRVWGGTEIGPFDAAYTIANNTCYATAYTFRDNPSFNTALAFPAVLTHHGDVVLRNNVVAGFAPDALNPVSLEWEWESALEAEDNVYDPVGGFVWDGRQPWEAEPLAAWSADTGYDVGSRQCVPAFVSIASGDLHLTASDACARSAASELALVPTARVDLDGDARPTLSPWDAGADQFTPRCGGDPVDPGPVCAPDASCVSVSAGLRCVCNSGFEGDGTTCSPTAPADECAPAPRTHCARPGSRGAKLQIKNRTTDRSDKLQFQWKGEIDAADLGDPTTSTSYRLCLYGLPVATKSLGVPAEDGSCGSRPCWKAQAKSGSFQYGDRSRADGGLSKVKLRPGIDRKGQIKIDAKGENLSEVATLPDALPVPVPVALTVQLVRTDQPSACWEAVFGPDAIRQNRDDRVQGKLSGGG